MFIYMVPTSFLRIYWYVLCLLIFRWVLWGLAYTKHLMKRRSLHHSINPTVVFASQPQAKHRLSPGLTLHSLMSLVDRPFSSPTGIVFLPSTSKSMYFPNPHTRFLGYSSQSPNQNTLRIIGPSKAWRHILRTKTPLRHTASGPLPLDIGENMPRHEIHPFIRTLGDPHRHLLNTFTHHPEVHAGTADLPWQATKKSERGKKRENHASQRMEDFAVEMVVVSFQVPFAHFQGRKVLVSVSYIRVLQDWFWPWTLSTSIPAMVACWAAWLWRSAKIVHKGLRLVAVESC